MSKKMLLAAGAAALLIISIVGSIVFSRLLTLSLSELEEKAGEIDTLFNVAARKHVDVYFQLADRYFKTENYEKSYSAVKKGLMLDPLRLTYQLLAVKIEIALKKYQAAAQRLDYILSAQPPLLLKIQCKLLAQKIPNKEYAYIPEAVHPLFSKKILLWVYPGIDRQLVYAITSRIQHEYRISIDQVPSPVAEDPNHSRDSFDMLAVSFINSFRTQSRQSVIDTFLKDTKLPNTVLHTKDGRRLFMQYVFLTLNNNPDAWQHFTSNYTLQYDASVLIKQIEQEYTAAISDKKDILGVLALTTHDIYSGDDNNNFLFGLYSGNIAVVSVNRFDCGNDVESAIVQSLTSAGHLIGIPRCSSPHCVRSYAHSLSEHHQKGSELCNECRENINRRYAEIETAGE
ncbi:MAG: archaemetzincin [Treponema sp.]